LTLKAHAVGRRFFTRGSTRWGRAAFTNKADNGMLVQLVVGGYGGAPPRPQHAFDGRQSPGARPDRGPTRGGIEDLSLPNTTHGVQGGLDEEG
jgi:hypothetical protein